MHKRKKRQEIIRETVREGRVRTQHDLVTVLASKGYDCTQATVSRDVEDLKLVKSSGGYYALSEDLYLQRMIHDLTQKIARADNMLVVHVHDGAAAVVAAAIDQAELDGVLGTVSGDTALFALCADSDAAQAAETNLKRYMGSGSDWGV
ncbi:MAG: ArgR family transcriptional regulator [Coriobacteriia bacterium]|nr:ArgR family transcriptional regulator [Coriobacteriia bacterium]